MIPIAFQMARRSGVRPSMFLMPMAFGSLLGGLMTQIGTSPNIIVSRVRGEMVGTPFTMFDFTPVGVLLSVVGVLFLMMFYWLLPPRDRQNASMDEAIRIKNYMTEARVGPESPMLDRTVADLQRLAGGGGMITAIIGANGRRRTPLPDTRLRADDILLMEGEPVALDRWLPRAASNSPIATWMAGGGRRDRRRRSDRRAKFRPGGYERADSGTLPTDRAQPSGSQPSRQEIHRTAGRDHAGNGRYHRAAGSSGRMPELLREWDCLPLAERKVTLGSVRRGLVPVAILLSAMLATALGIVPVAVAFFAAAVLMVLTRAIPWRDVYSHLDGPILIMLAALIPVSETLRTSGATDLIGAALAQVATMLPPYGALALILLAAMAVTPFLNNAATVLVMAPIAATFATSLGFRPEAFLMAVAIGAAAIS